MKEQEIVKYIEGRLAERGKDWSIEFIVSEQVLEDGGWLQVYLTSNATSRNRAAESQIISDVEEEATVKSGREVLLVSVSKIDVA